MPTCEISGKEVDEVTVRIIGGAELHVCEEYSHLGEPLNGEEGEEEKSGSEPQEDADRPPRLVEDYDTRVSEAREQSGLTPDELSERLNIEAETLRSIEAGSDYPSSTARVQLEQFLNITLIEGNESNTEDIEPNRF